MSIFSEINGDPSTQKHQYESTSTTYANITIIAHITTLKNTLTETFVDFHLYWVLFKVDNAHVYCKRIKYDPLWTNHQVILQICIFYMGKK